MSDPTSSDQASPNPTSNALSTVPAPPPPTSIVFPPKWHRRDLLELKDLEAWEIQTLLDVAQQLKEMTDGCRRKAQILSGKTCANLFFENSTRTRNSFSLAAKRLGADTVEFSSSGSSVAKGETFVDTAKTI
ncbi:MAG: hypothetical protein AAFP69_11260, partial [Planctomycetota bacterium]